MKIEREYLETLTVGQLMMLFPDNNDLFHDSGMWNISIDHQAAITYRNSDLRNLLLGYLVEYEFVDAMDIAVRKCDADGVTEKFITF